MAGSSNTFRQAYFDPNPRRNYVLPWNLTIQRELAKDLSTMIAYVGSRGVHQPFRVEVDTSSSSLVGDEYTNSISSPLWLNPRVNRGLSDFNVAQNVL